MITSISEMAEMFKALGDATRLQIVKLLLSKGNQLCVGMLARKLGISQPAVSQQLKVLKNAGIVQATRAGFHMHYTVIPGAAKELGVNIPELFKGFRTELSREEHCEAKGDEKKCAERN